MTKAAMHRGPTLRKIRVILRRRSARVAAVGAALVVLLSGCNPLAQRTNTNVTQSPSPDGSSSPGPSPTASPSASQGNRSPSPGVSTTAAAGLLKRRDAPPEGVKAQFEFFAEGDGLCIDLDETKPSVVVEHPEPQIASVFYLCFPGFKPGADIEVRTSLPDGSIRQNRIQNVGPGRQDGAGFFDSTGFLAWYALPGDPLGDYKVTATQGALNGAGGFSVTAASTPRVLVAPQAYGRPGTTFQIAIAGFEESKSVPFYLYRRNTDGTRYSYLTEVPIQMDRRGQTLFNLPTTPQDPPGVYCLIYRGAKAAPDYGCGLNVFTLEP